MELMVGGTLDARLKPSLPLAEVPGVLADVLAGLEVAHQRGIVHRDLKPANIFFSAAGRAKLGDFGVAHLLDLGQTQTGGFIGSLAYMSPEQITGSRLTVAADFYALGVTLYLMLTGRLPFAGPDFAMQHLAEYPPPPSVAAPGLPAELESVIAKLLAKEPAARYQSASELSADLGGVPWGTPAPLALARPRARTEPPRNDPPTNQRPDAERYLDETPLGATARSRLYAARDTVLGRGVVLERFGEAAPAGPEAGPIIDDEKPSRACSGWRARAAAACSACSGSIARPAWSCTKAPTASLPRPPASRIRPPWPCSRGWPMRSAPCTPRASPTAPSSRGASSARVSATPSRSTACPRPPALPPPTSPPRWRWSVPPPRRSPTLPPSAPTSPSSARPRAPKPRCAPT